MLEIRGITDRQGNSKDDRLKEIAKKHGSTKGYLQFPIVIGNPFYFVYKDDEEKCLRSSYVEKYEYVREDRLYIVTTRNSIYYIVDIDNCRY